MLRGTNKQISMERELFFALYLPHEEKNAMLIYMLIC